MRRKTSLAVLCTALLVTVASVSIAGATGPTKPKLSFVKTQATIGWSNEGGSSPGGGVSNTNTQSLKINATGVTGTSGASAYTYGTDEDLVGIRGRALSAIDHLGFDSKGYLGNGAPRISLGTTDSTLGNHQYFLAAFYCNDATSGGWRTSDFVNDTTDCTIFRDGVQMTWQQAIVLADAAGEVVSSTPNDWFLNQDEAPALLYVDRLSVQEWCWTGNGTNGIINQNSGDCI
jgi:hypothetical protein